MPLSMLFWFLFIVWLLFGGYRYRTDYGLLGGHGLLAVLIFLIGWATFGFVITGK